MCSVQSHMLRPSAISFPFQPQVPLEHGLLSLFLIMCGFFPLPCSGAAPPIPPYGSSSSTFSNSSNPFAQPLRASLPTFLPPGAPTSTARQWQQQQQQQYAAGSQGNLPGAAAASPSAPPPQSQGQHTHQQQQQQPLQQLVSWGLVG